MQLHVIGGGLTGLVAAVEAAERGARVQLSEAHAQLGGRARASTGPYVAHQGPHVIYRDGPTWAWLARRRLVEGAGGVPLRSLSRFYFRRSGVLRRLPPRGVLQVLAFRRSAPVEPSFAAWAGQRWGAETASLAAAASGVATFHHDPGSLSARFVQERLQRVFSVPPQATYLRGGWPVLVERLAAAARERGVCIETGHRVTALPGGGPVVVAVPLASARRLLGDDGLHQPGGATALLDVAVRTDRRDAFVVSDLDAGGWLERFTVPDPSLAPAGESLVQAQVPFGPDDSREVALGRVEGLLDLGLPDWRSRLTWRRDALARGRTGAVDLPGRTWRDRPAVDRGGGVFLAGDEVAAPGLLSEVAFCSALAAVDGALAGSRVG
jgi:phytoene dehydrogenase-like protein